MTMHNDLNDPPTPQPNRTFRAKCLTHRQYAEGTPNASWDATFEIVDENHFTGQQLTLSGVGPCPYKATFAYEFTSRVL